MHLNKNGVIFFIYILLSLNLYASGFPARASVSSCEQLLKLTATQLAEIKPSFASQHNTHYDLEVDENTVRDQCQYGGCWAYATVAEIEKRILVTQKESIELSEQYLIFVSLLGKVAAALKNPEAVVGPGGSTVLAKGLINHYGFIPKGIWEPRIPFENSPHSTRLIYFLNSRIAKFHLDSANTTDATQKQKLVDEATTDLEDQLFTYFGNPPTSFTYNGKTYSSPKEFAESKLPVSAQNLVHVWRGGPELPASLEKPKPAPVNVSPPVKSTPAIYTSVKLPPALLQNWIVEHLKRGEIIPIGVEMISDFIDKKTGIMSINAFNTPEGFEPPPRSYRARFDLQGGHHAMDIIGVDTDPHTGEILKYKLRNSWGTKAGDHGVYHMYADYFENFVNSLFFFGTNKTANTPDTK